MTVTAYRAAILHFLYEPEDIHDVGSYQYLEDGLLVVEDGKVKAVGDASQIKKAVPADTPIVDYSGYLIMPGFIDAHVHYPQLEMIASYGEHLLEWLSEYVFPAEAKYSDYDYAKASADFFLKELLRNGTTTAMVYATAFEASADALFAAALEQKMRIIGGKVSMDRNVPEVLQETLQTTVDSTQRLIDRWHGKERLSYAITPRFVPTCSEAHLEAVGDLMKKNPTTYLQTHLSENRKEVEFVQELCPWAKHYTDVYDHFGLLGERSVFGHCIYLSDEELDRFRETKSVIAWCPTSNLFLGSGLFPLRRAREHQVRIATATDVGGGSSLSMLRTLNEAYKVVALEGFKLSSLLSFYFLTLGNARMLSLGDKLGNFEAGKEADFVVVDFNCTPLLSKRTATEEDIADKLFTLSILGDDRAISATYILGKLSPNIA